ncbi:hypothetical protein EV360DRAFT_89305 [Lentinula raphanica]|nr:hypothetical protein EV360DRAFT_89305 [Lentinula raphanica]
MDDQMDAEPDVDVSAWVTVPDFSTLFLTPASLERLDYHPRVSPNQMDDQVVAEAVSADAVPPDILSLIFQYTLLLTHRYWQCRFVIVLASVCQSWRATCIDTPCLWSRIGPLIRTYDIIRLFLQRSHNCPLFIEYDKSGEDERILPLLALESERWFHVRFDIAPSSYPLLSSIRGRLPLLRTLILWHAWGGEVDIGTSTNESDTSTGDLNTARAQDQEYFPGFETAPSLLEFAFHSPYLKESFPLPWIQLTELTCSQAHSSNLYPILLNVPNLSQLFLSRLIYDSIDESVIPDGHTFPLVVLHVTDCDLRVLHSILRRIPNIEVLTIDIWERVKMCDCHTPIVLPNLNSLCIQVNRYVPFFAQSFKVHAPMLSKLKFECDDVMDDDEDEDDGNEDVVPLWFVGGLGSAMLRFLTEFIKDAGCVLTSLKLEMEVDFDSVDMESLLRVVPSLEHLDIKLVVQGGHGRIPLEAMTPACTTLPNLKTFYLRIPRTDFTFDEVQQLLSFVAGSMNLKVKLC